MNADLLSYDFVYKKTKTPNKPLPFFLGVHEPKLRIVTSCFL